MVFQILQCLNGHICFSKDDADGMVDWLMNWKNNTNFKLNMDEIKGSWTKLADREELAKKYPNSVDTKSVLDITFATERDASLVDFIDSTNGKVLSRHKAGFAVHVTVTNKSKPKICLLYFKIWKTYNV